MPIPSAANKKTRIFVRERLQNRRRKYQEGGEQRGSTLFLGEKAQQQPTAEVVVHRPKKLVIKNEAEFLTKHSQ